MGPSEVNHMAPKKNRLYAILLSIVLILSLVMPALANGAIGGG